jgi:hypothetical protein
MTFNLYGKHTVFKTQKPKICLPLYEKKIYCQLILGLRPSGFETKMQLNTDPVRIRNNCTLQIHPDKNPDPVRIRNNCTYNKYVPVRPIDRLH